MEQVQAQGSCVSGTVTGAGLLCLRYRYRRRAPVSQVQVQVQGSCVSGTGTGAGILCPRYRYRCRDPVSQVQVHVQDSCSRRGCACGKRLWVGLGCSG